MAGKNPEFVYQRLARELAQAIRQGVYAVNERMPSLRRVSGHYQVSLASVVQAYAQLEQEGLVEARPRSGYFVRPWLQARRDPPALTQPLSRPTAVNVGQLAQSLVTESRSPGLLRLGAAVPGLELLPVRNLSRILAGTARSAWRDAGAYEGVQGALPLRRQIARLMRQAGCRCTPDDIIVTNGCLEALSLTLRVLAAAGDTIAIESPTYFGILQVIESLGMRALEIATHPERGVDVDALAQVVARQRIKACILMPNHSNPTGARMPDAAKQRVVSLLAAAGVPLIEDDVYGPLSYRQPRPRAAKAWDGDGGVVLCSSFSKTLAPGYRIGWVFSQRYREQLLYQKFLGNISTATLPQLAIGEFLSRGGYLRCLRTQVHSYHLRMQQLQHWLNAYFPAGTRVSQPEGGFVCWVELPPTVDSLTLYQQALARRIAISPGVLFCARGQYRHQVRMSCGAVEGESLRRAVQTLAGLVRTAAGAA